MTCEQAVDVRLTRLVFSEPRVVHCRTLLDQQGRTLEDLMWTLLGACLFCACVVSALGAASASNVNGLNCVGHTLLLHTLLGIKGDITKKRS